MHTRKTFCRFCHANCAIEVDIEGERAVAVRGDVSDPLFGGYTCMKGRELPAQANHPERLRSSRRRLRGRIVRPDFERRRARRDRRTSRGDPRTARSALDRHLLRHVRIHELGRVAGGAGVPPGARQPELLHEHHDRSASQGLSRQPRRHLARRTAALLAGGCVDDDRQQPPHFALRLAGQRAAVQPVAAAARRKGARPQAHLRRPETHDGRAARGHPPAGAARRGRDASRGYAEADPGRGPARSRFLRQPRRPGSRSCTTRSPTSRRSTLRGVPTCPSPT